MIESTRKLKELDENYLAERAKLTAAVQAEMRALTPLRTGWQYYEKDGYWCARTDGSERVEFSAEGVIAADIYNCGDSCDPVPAAIVVAVLRANGVLP